MKNKNIYGNLKDVSVGWIDVYPYQNKEGNVRDIKTWRDKREEHSWGRYNLFSGGISTYLSWIELK